MECTESSAMEGILNLLDTHLRVMKVNYFIYLLTLRQQAAQVDDGGVGAGNV